MLKIVLPSFQEADPGLKNSCRPETDPGRETDLYLFRHGNTCYNLERRYQGRVDPPLVLEEYSRIKPYSFGPFAEMPEVVYVSGARRSVQTAQLLFPGIRQVVIPEFWEMDMGVFDGRSAEEMESDPQYRSWIDSMCEAQAPGGESREQFEKRVTDRFFEIALQAVRERKKTLVIVAHGGTQMAVMNRFCEEKRTFWSWQTPPGEAIRAKLHLM